MTTWKARLSRDGDRVLCGWTVNGQTPCPATIGWVVNIGGVAMVEFQEFYVQARPKEPGETLLLKITAPAHNARGKGAMPLPGQRNKMLVRKRFDLPADAPCFLERLHGLSRVDAERLSAPAAKGGSIA